MQSKHILAFVTIVLSISVVSSFKLRTDSCDGIGEDTEYKPKLSDYNFFSDKLSDLKPNKDVIPYDLRTPLFSDYAYKKRFVYVPEGKKIKYNAKSVLDFPVGTVLIKNFYYPFDFRKEEKGGKIIETRLLIHKEDGWLALPYIWNDDQTEAYLEVTGGRKNISWIDLSGKKKSLEYIIPNMNQCKSCHTTGTELLPIGPSARQLNKDFNYNSGINNQLKEWGNLGILTELPSLSEVPKIAIWNDSQTGDLNARARAWLDINCAHCHNENGPANTSGLWLSIHDVHSSKIGIMKSPVAAGRGSGNRLFDIVPGKPSESILLYRIESTDPGVMMPELGRKLVDEEGVKLVSEWIKSLDSK